MLKRAEISNSARFCVFILFSRETFGNTTLDFSYDSQGNPYTLTYTVGTATPLIYHYVVNFQGDVIRIVNAASVTRVIL